MEARRVAAGNGWQWISNGFGLFKASPVIWIALFFIYLLIGMALGLAAGLLAVARPGSFVSRALQGLGVFLLCCPPYWLPFLLLILFAPGIAMLVEVPFMSTPNLYRDEPILHLPFRLLTALVELDEGFTTWRYRHVMMVQRMIGAKIGTGGSSGSDYLRQTTENNRFFRDLTLLSTFLLPRSALPQLPESLRAALDFHANRG